VAEDHKQFDSLNETPSESSASESKAVDTALVAETNQHSDVTQSSLPSETAEPIQTKANDPSDTEDIRRLLGNIQTPFIIKNSGTITFTKTNQSVKKKSSGWRVAGFILLFTALIGLGSIFYIRQQLSPVSPGVSAPTEFEVEPGWGASRVAHELETTGLIRNARVFTFYLQQQNLDRAIGEGLYDLDPAMSVAEIAMTLNQGGRPRVVRVVIPEGFRMTDIATALSRAGFGNAATLLALFQNSDGIKPIFVEAGKSLEGYLFPASYDIAVRSTLEETVQLFLTRFQQELTPEVQAALSERDWTIPGWVTLASMVQAEAANATEMPIIAGVFLNRLEEGMALQSDPTVAYGLGKDLPELNYDTGDFQQENAWNTYLNAGLPETPINNPGHEALQAVLNPQRENEDGEKYFYFLHGTDEGQPVFKPNITFEDHERDIALYLR
jgi:UPF0755 protein